jgi:hypothetical protein
MFGPGVPLPGQVVQLQRTETGAVATGTTLVPMDDTIPQNTEGTEFMTRAITPASAANLLHVSVRGTIAQNAAGANNVVGALFVDSVASAVAAMLESSDRQDANASVVLDHTARAGSTSTITFKFRAGPQVAATVTFNGAGAARKFGGVMNAWIQAEEVMA